MVLDHLCSFAHFLLVGVSWSYLNKWSVLMYVYTLQQLLLEQKGQGSGSVPSRNSKPYINITPTRVVYTDNSMHTLNRCCVFDVLRPVCISELSEKHIITVTTFQTLQCKPNVRHSGLDKSLQTVSTAPRMGAGIRLEQCGSGGCWVKN